MTKQDTCDMLKAQLARARMEVERLRAEVNSYPEYGISQSWAYVKHTNHTKARAELEPILFE